MLGKSAKNSRFVPETPVVTDVAMTTRRLKQLKGAHNRAMWSHTFVLQGKPTENPFKKLIKQIQI